MLESQIQSKIIKYLEGRGCYVARIIKASKAGTPDLITCYQGKFYGLEIKTATGRPSPLQIYHLSKIEEAGGISAIVRSVDDVRALFTSSGEGDNKDL